MIWDDIVSNYNWYRTGSSSYSRWKALAQYVPTNAVQHKISTGNLSPGGQTDDQDFVEAPELISSTPSPSRPYLPPIGFSTLMPSSPFHFHGTTIFRTPAAWVLQASTQMEGPGQPVPQLNLPASSFHWRWYLSTCPFSLHAQHVALHPRFSPIEPWQFWTPSLLPHLSLGWSTHHCGEDLTPTWAEK